jgi:glycosyltransferase involved in cell wall biosynthesis
MAMTVLQVAYPLAPVSRDTVGGAEQILAHLDAALVRRGHRSIVVAAEGSSVAGTLVPVPAERGVLDEAARARAQAATREAIAGALRRFPVDLVHLHGIDFPAYRPDGVPTLATLHLPPDWYPPEIWHDHPGLLLHCVSAAQARACPPGARLLDPIPNGVPTEALATTLKRRDFALMLGRVCPEKGVHLAIEAAKAAGTSLLIGGQVYPYESHVRYFETEVRPRLDARRRFLGPVGFSRKRRLLGSARCLLVPSLCAETSSLVSMEALAAGAPVVAFPNGALPEIVEHGRTGFLVDGPEEMADAIRAVDRIDREVCRASARSRFSLERMVDRYLDAYGTVLANAAVPS